jgi:hypothetical protein
MTKQTEDILRNAAIGDTILLLDKSVEFGMKAILIQSMHLLITETKFEVQKINNTEVYGDSIYFTSEEDAKKYIKENAIENYNQTLVKLKKDHKERLKRIQGA